LAAATGERVTSPSRRVMRTVKPGIHPGAVPLQMRSYMTVQQVHILFGIVAPRHTGLVGDDNHQKTGFIQQSYGLWRTGDKYKIIRAEEVLFFLVDGTITINKHSPFHGRSPAPIKWIYVR